MSNNQNSFEELVKLWQNQFKAFQENPELTKAFMANFWDFQKATMENSAHDSNSNSHRRSEGSSDTFTNIPHELYDTILKLTARVLELEDRVRKLESRRRKNKS